MLLVGSSETIRDALEQTLLFFFNFYDKKQATKKVTFYIPSSCFL